MKRLSEVLAVLLAVLSVPALAEEATGAADALSSLSQEQVISDDCTPARVLELCRAMVPADVVIGGRVNRRSRHGRTVASYGFVLKRRASGGRTFPSTRRPKPSRCPGFFARCCS